MSAMDTHAGTALPRRVHRDSNVWEGRSAMDTDRQMRDYERLCGPVTITRRPTAEELAAERRDFADARYRGELS